LPGGGQLIRYADGATSTVTIRSDGGVHVVDRDPIGRIVDTYDLPGDITPDDAPPESVAGDQPVSLLEAGATTVAAAAVTGSAVAAVLRARRARAAASATGRRNDVLPTHLLATCPIRRVRRSRGR
jgi:hypothetical protein